MSTKQTKKNQKSKGVAKNSTYQAPDLTIFIQKTLNQYKYESYEFNAKNA